MLSLKNHPADHITANKDGAADPGFGVYIHWPFCLSKCPYCDFNSHVRETVDQARWRAALVRELTHQASLTTDRQVSSIFFGGGTPSLMPKETVAAVIDTVYELWPVADNIEITLEANPTSIEIDKFRDFKAAGINRVSIGVQSLRDDDLLALGRTHSAAEAMRAIETARSVFDRYSFDLIYARSQQTPDQWASELTEALTHAGAHMSLYQLTIEPGTAFYTRHQRGDLPIPEDEVAAEFYAVTQDIMNAAGLPAYETSNHAAPGQQSAHNLTYWRYGSYIGCGPGAHGRLLLDNNRYATRTHLAPEKWHDLVEQQGHGAHPFERLSARQQAEEWLMMGLRLFDGINLDQCEVLTGYPARQLLDQKMVDMLCDSGHLSAKGNTLSATAQGMLCLNAVLGKIISDPDLTPAVPAD